MTGPVRRLRALPIRARLSLLVAAAVAFAVAAVSVTCWFIVQGKWYGEIDDDLRYGNVRVSLQEIQSTLANCTTEVTDGSVPLGPPHPPLPATRQGRRRLLRLRQLRRLGARRRR
ncbi:hypothetical protein GCM10020295_45340 [Streptomyces cinereospinus]